MFPAMKQHLGRHECTDDGNLGADVTRWLIIEDMYFYIHKKCNIINLHCNFNSLLHLKD